MLLNLEPMISKRNLIDFLLNIIKSEIINTPISKTNEIIKT